MNHEIVGNSLSGRAIRRPSLPFVERVRNRAAEVWNHWAIAVVDEKDIRVALRDGVKIALRFTDQETASIPSAASSSVLSLRQQQAASATDARVT
ncbi:MAG: hypothetical protein ACRELF_17805 [Gemmataceae bacterium]